MGEHQPLHQDLLARLRTASLPAKYEIVALSLASLVTFAEVGRGLALGAVSGPMLLPTIGYAALFLLPLGSALLVLLGHRLAHLASAAAVLLILALTASFLVPTLADPGLPYWPSVYASSCALVAAISFSALGELERHAKRSNRPVPPRASAAVGPAAAMFLGIAVGGMVVGLVAGGAIARLLDASPEAADVVIARGSWDPAFHQSYQPAVLAVRSVTGASVTWYNADTEPHTVTADDGSFDSGVIPPGGSWTHVFAAPGTFGYYCRPHPWMNGVVNVEA